MCQQRVSNVLKIKRNLVTKGNWLVNQAIVEKLFLYGALAFVLFLICEKLLRNKGNLMVMVVILRHHKMRTVTNFFLCNLALADFCVGVFCVIPNLMHNITAEWFLGRFLCKCFYFVQAMSYTASVIILIVISFERYVAIIYPMRSKQFTSLLLLRIVIVIVWIIAALSGIPYLVIYDTWTIPIFSNGTLTSTITFCSLSPGTNLNTKAQSLASIILGYIIPLVLITCMYTRISVVLWSSSVGGKLIEKVGKKETNIKHSSKKKVSGGSAEKKIPKVRLPGRGNDEEMTALDPARINGEANENIKQVRWQDSTDECSYMDKDSSSEPAIDYIDDWPKRDSEKRDKVKFSRNYTNNPSGGGGGKMVVSLNCSTAQRHKSRNPDNALIARRKVIRLLVTVIISFALCVLPYHIRMLWASWFIPQIEFTELLIPPITFIFYYMNSGLNPILYAFLSENFRRSLLEVITCSQRTSKRGAARNITFSRTTHYNMNSSYNMESR